MTNDSKDRQQQKTDMDHPAEAEALTESIGTRFRRERQSQHKTIEDVAKATCIHLRSLKALEDDDYDQLPAPVFTKGFIKIYAEYLGLDQKEILSHYVTTASNAPLVGNKIYNQAIISTDPTDEPEKTSSGKKIMTVFAVLFVGIFLYIASSIMFPNTPMQESSLDRQQQASITEEIIEPPLETEEKAALQEPAPNEEEPSISPSATTSDLERAALKPEKTKPAPPVAAVKTEIIETKIAQPEIAQKTADMTKSTAQANEDKPATREETVIEDVKPTTAKAEKIAVIKEESTNPKQTDAAATAELQPETVPKTTPEPVEKPELITKVTEKPQLPPATPVAPQTEITQEQEGVDKTVAEKTTGTDAEVTTSPEAEFNYILKADFIAPTWLRVRVDGKRPRQYTYRAGTNREWRAQEQIRLHIGNAAGIKLTLNGSPLPISAKPGKVVKLSIPRDLP